MGTNVKLMGMSHRAGDSVYKIYASYKDVGQRSEVGKILMVDLGSTQVASTAKIFDFTDSLKKLADN